MLNDPVLMNDWHVVAYAPGLKANEPMAVRLLEEDLVLWRVGDKIHAWRDLCVHRGTRLSLGKIQGETLMCPYHGWTYNEAGQCIRFPAHPTQNHLPQPVSKPTKRVRNITGSGFVWLTLPGINARGFFLHPGSLLLVIAGRAVAAPCPEAFLQGKPAGFRVPHGTALKGRKRCLQNVARRIVIPVQHHATIRTNVSAYTQGLLHPRATR